MCHVSANPPIRLSELTWSLEGGPLPNDVMLLSDRLVIIRVTQKHLGNYTCYVRGKKFSITIQAQIGPILGGNI